MRGPRACGALSKSQPASTSQTQYQSLRTPRTAREHIAAYTTSLQPPTRAACARGQAAAAVALKASRRWCDVALVLRMPARRRELARSAALRTLLACLLLRTAPPARAAAGAGGIGALSLPQGGAAALRVYLAGGGTRVCYSLNNPDNTAWVGQSGCVASGLPAIPSAATCQRLLDIVASATNTKTRQSNGLFTIVLVPTAPVTSVGAPFAFTCSAADKETRRRARVIVRDVMAAGLDLFCQRTRAEFTAAFEITAEAQLAVAQREWAWKTLTDDLRLRWAYAAFRVRYLT